MTREEIDKVIESAEAGKTEHQRDGLLMDDNEDYMALLAAVKQLREERQWQPIETAPKDGVWFLAFEDGDVYKACFSGDGYFMSACGQPVVYNPEPTRWMPLPDDSQDVINDRIEKGRR